MNTPFSQPDPTGDPRKTSDYRTHQLQDAAARTLRVERTRLEKLWNQHLDGELSAESKSEFEALCKRYPDLSRELRTTGMLLSGMNLLTADVPASPVSDRDRSAAILAAVQAERPFISAGEARAIRRQRWILAGSAAALLVAVVVADRFFPGWIDPAGMSVASRSPNASALVTSSPSSVLPSDDVRAVVANTAATPPAPAVKREAINASAKLSLSGASSPLKLTTELAPTMASQATGMPLDIPRAFGLQTQEEWFLHAMASGSQPIEPFVASARLRLSDPVFSSTTFSRPQSSSSIFFDGRWKGLLNELEGRASRVEPTNR